MASWRGGRTYIVGDGHRLRINRDASLTAAIIAGNSQEFTDFAENVADRARALALEHVDTGDYFNSISVEKERGLSGRGRLVNDRMIYVNDKAAVSIEYGHYMGRQGTPNRRFIPGQYILTRAAASYSRRGR